MLLWTPGVFEALSRVLGGHSYFQSNIISLWGWHLEGKPAGILAQIKAVVEMVLEVVHMQKRKSRGHL